MTPQERAALCRRIASSGGRSTLARHGTEHMAAIGRKGFAVAVELGWGPVLAEKLSPGYAAKFGKPITLSPASLEKARIRAEARAIYAGMTCDVPGCAAPGQVHHIHGLTGDEPNDGLNISIRCEAHHRAIHRERRRDHLRRPRKDISCAS